MSKVKIIGKTAKDKIKLENQVLDLIKGRLMTIKKELTDLNQQIQYYSDHYNMNNEEFLQSFSEGKLGDDEDFFVWHGVINIKKSLLEEQELLRETL